MIEDLMLRLARGETLKAEEAQAVLNVLTSDTPWQFGVQLALAYLDLDQLDYARSTLEQLLEADAGRGGPACPPSSWP